MTLADVWRKHYVTVPPTFRKTRNKFQRMTLKEQNDFCDELMRHPIDEQDVRKSLVLLTIRLKTLCSHYSRRKRT